MKTSLYLKMVMSTSYIHIRPSVESLKRRVFNMYAGLINGKAHVYSDK